MRHGGTRYARSRLRRALSVPRSPRKGVLRTIALRALAVFLLACAALLGSVAYAAPVVVTPSGFTAMGGERKLDLSWTAAASGVTVDRYQYRLSTDGADTWSTGWTDVRFSDHSTTSHTVTGLPDATDYTIELRIRAGSLRSDAARTTARTDNLPNGYTGTPTAPTDLTVTLAHSCHVDMYWSAPSSNGGKAITKYQQRTREGNGSFGPWETDLDKPLATHVDFGDTASCDYSYTFQVLAVNADGAGPRASITFRPLDDGPPNEPVDLVAVGGIQRVALSWKTPATFRQITYYQARYRNDEHPDNPWTSWTRIPNSNYRTTRHTVTGLAYNVPYILEVRAVNSAGAGASAQQRARTQTEPVDAPSGFTATAGIRKVDLAWTAAASTVAVEAYQYRLSSDGGDNWNRWTDIAGSSGSTTRHTVSRLANGTAYTVELRIRAGTTHSNSVSGSATTPDVPSAPVLSAMPGQRSITLTWTPPHDGGRAITRYQYRRTRMSPGFTTWNNIRGSGPNTTSYTHRSGLLEGWRYTFEVRAVNAVGNSRAGSVDGTTAVSADPTIRTWRAFGVEGRHATVDFSVQLHPAASSTVTVDYRTEDSTATAPADYQATNGRLTFAPGETEKTVSVPIVDDTVEDSGEWFWLRLSHALVYDRQNRRLPPGALLGDKYAGGWIYNHEDVLAGFTLVDAAAGTDVGALADGTEVTLDAPATGQYGVRVETLPEAAIGSLRLELSGAKAVTRTDNAAPYTLYAEGGEGLPPGGYTLQATAYPDADGGGTALQTLSVSFTVTAAEASNTAPTGLPEIAGTAEVGGTLTASADDVEDADGLDNATFAWQWLANDGAEDADLAGATGTTYEPGPADVGKTIKVRATFTDDDGAAETVESAATEAVVDLRPTVTGLAMAAPVGGWTDGDTVRLSIGFSAPVTVATDGGTPSVAIALDGTARQAAYAGGSGRSSLTFSYALTADDGTVAAVSVAADALAANGGTIRDADGRDANLAHAGFDTAAGEPEPAPLTASFSNVPATHDGSAGFSFELAFSEEVGISYVTMRDDAFEVDEGDVTGARRVNGRHDLWEITVEPDGREAVSITLPGERACGTTGAVCTRGEDPRPLSNSPSATVAGPTAAVTPTVGIAGGSGTEGDGDIAFAVTLDRAGADTVTVDYATADGTADDDDYTATSGTLSFAAGTTSGTITVPIADDDVNEGDETFTVALSNASGATLGTAGATGTVRNRHVAPTASIAGGGGKEGDDDAIAFAVTLDRAAAAAVTVDYATSDGSATAGEDYTATSGTLSFAAGETGKTITVPIGDDIVNESDETFTVTLSNASGAVLGTASATGTIENRHVTPLTASFGNVPAEHDGTTFVFHVRFSEDPAVSYLVLRDESFGVTGGEVVAARRKDGRDDLREIHVEPSGNGDVTVSLPPTTDCNADGAAPPTSRRCRTRGDGARAWRRCRRRTRPTEAAGASIDFVVRLSRAASGPVTVDYATADGSATAGADYTAASGTLTFSSSQTSKTVSVTVLDDTHDDGGETFTLRLSNAAGARIADSEATGTIENSDPLPKGWLSRFGRTSAVQVVGLLDARFDEARAPASQFTLGGRSVTMPAPGGHRRDSTDPADGSVEPGAGAAATDADPFAAPASRYTPDDAARGITDLDNDPTAPDTDPFAALASRYTPADAARGRTEPDNDPAALSADPTAPAVGAGGEATLLERTVWGLLTESAWQVDKRRFISRSSFDLSLSALGNDPDESIETVAATPDVPGRWSMWGRGALTYFGGIDDGVSLDGDVLTGLLGVDYARDRWLAGVALAYHDGDGSYRSARRGDAGELDSALVSVNPYLRYALTERLSAWGALGYGQGTLRLRPERDATVPQESIETAMQMGMGALGLRGVLYASAGTELALKSDALWVRTSSADAPGLRAVDRADTSRMRLLLSGRHQRALANDALLTPSFELGLRVDDGDAERGFGMELGGGLRYADPVRGLALETRARALLAHEDGGYEEWGLGGSLSLDPGRLGRGLALRLDSGWGMADSGAEALWQRQSAAGLGRQDNTPAQGRITAEMGYGLDVPYSYGILTPYSSVELAGGGSRTLRLGWRFELGQRLSLSLAGERRETAHARPEHGLMLRTTLPW